MMVGFGCVCFTLLAQEYRFHNVQKLPSSVNTQVEEGTPLLSADGRKLFFTRALYPANSGGKFSGLDIWVSEWNGYKWMPARNSISLNDHDHNVIVGMNKRNLYFTRSSGWSRTHGVYRVEPDRSGFTRPRLIPIPGIDNLDFLSFYVSPDLDVIFLSMKAPDSRGQEDIYFSVKSESGAWTTPKSVGTTINTSGFEVSPFLSADKSRLYFASNGHEGFGDADIFYCERMYDSWETWSAPVNLGDVINSKKFDAYFSIYGDSVAFFASNRDGRYADIYQVKVSKPRTILAKGQRYLDRALMSRHLGENVGRAIVFKGETSTLDQSQRELLFYITNKLMLERDIHFHLVVREENDSTLTKDRVNVIYQNLLSHGIDSGRIRTDQVEPAMKSDRAVVELMLFK